MPIGIDGWLGAGAVELRDRFTNAGFKDAGFLPLMGGSIAVHYGTKE